MILRTVDLYDLKDILKWRNDKVTRRNSFNQKKISLKEHTAWFNQTSVRKDVEMLIIEDNWKKIGFIHLDKKGDNYEVNINIAPRKRNMGYGVEILKLLKKRYKNMVAYIKLNNEISKHTFEKAGFKPFCIGYKT